MIEIVWKDPLARDYDVIMCATSLLAWLTSTIAQNEEYHNIEFNGYMLAQEKTVGCSMLIYCGYNPENRRRLLNILQQPPEEYKGKYIAHTLSREPMPVEEQTDSNSDETGECKIEVSESEEAT